ncbi:MAG: hypothetical protein ACOX60_05465 [Massiliimalia sp.]
MKNERTGLALILIGAILALIPSISVLSMGLGVISGAVTLAGLILLRTSHKAFGKAMWVYLVVVILRIYFVLNGLYQIWQMKQGIYSMGPSLAGAGGLIYLGVMLMGYYSVMNGLDQLCLRRGWTELEQVINKRTPTVCILIGVGIPLIILSGYLPSLLGYFFANASVFSFIARILGAFIVSVVGNALYIKTIAQVMKQQKLRKSMTTAEKDKGME